MHRGASVLVVVLVLVFLIPVLTVSYFAVSSFLNQKNLKDLPAKTLTTLLREVITIDKDGKEIRYWVLDTANHGPESLFNCRLTVTSKGDNQAYIGFSQSYVLRNCNSLSVAKDNYDCRLNNALARWTRLEKSQTWARLPAGGSLVAPVGSFYIDQTVSALSFYAKHRLNELLNLTVVCHRPSGPLVRQVILL